MSEKKGREKISVSFTQKDFQKYEYAKKQPEGASKYIVDLIAKDMHPHLKEKETTAEEVLKGIKKEIDVALDLISKN